VIYLLFQGQYDRFVLVIIGIIISLSFHEYGHARTAKMYGDDTAERAGRLTLNPIVHIDPIGLLMVAIIGFGFARPVPINPRRFNSYYATALVSAAGPAMNLILAFVFVNLSIGAYYFEIDFLMQAGPQFFFIYMANINMLLMLFNLLPIGPLDGHYILPYFLTKQNAYRYSQWNAQYGIMVLMGLVLLSFMGVPIFSFLFRLGSQLAQYLVIF